MPSFPQHRLKRRPAPSVQNKTEEKWVFKFNSFIVYWYFKFFLFDLIFSMHWRKFSNIDRLVAGAAIYDKGLLEIIENFLFVDT